ncbi:MAG: alpha/beta hydrolase [Phycisphaerales bacterium]|nr:alpha/beta hydrolase [Phycisphaerales bacterium]
MAHRSCSKLLAAGSLAAFTHIASGQVTPTFANVQYGDGLSAQTLDVYRPAGASGALPCVVWIHGGGWQNGDKFPAPKATSLLGLGIAAVSINYRLSGQASHPAQMHDCKAAIRYVRAHAATFGIDPARIAVWGSSAGGHLVSLIGTSGDVPSTEGAVGGNLAFAGPVVAVADYFGPSEFLSITTPGHTSCASPESAMLGVCLGEVINNQSDPAFASSLAKVREASPTTHVSPNDPPFFIAHGSADPVVELQQSMILHEDLVAAGVEARIRVVAGAGHGLPVQEDFATRKFLAAKLGVPVCPGDFNASGSLSSQDIFDFLNLWFASNPAADFDESGGAGFDDVFGFLNAWFAGC